MSMTISLVAVFIPVLFMRGLLGRLFQEFAVTISAAILVSGFVSLTLTPMLCSRLLRRERPGDGAHGRIANTLERAFNRILAAYERTLHVVLRHRRVTLATLVLMAVLAGFLFWVAPKGFIPNEDIGFLRASVEGLQGISYEEHAGPPEGGGRRSSRPTPASSPSSLPSGREGRTRPRTRARCSSR